MTTASRESQIREIAYGLWEQEGMPEGRDVEHYFKAEQLAGSETAQAAVAAFEPTALPGAETAATASTRARKSTARKSAVKR
jgi:hypothetical protein